MLGLMGTLIPMGPALMNLASGNISEMATNMIVVFSTTVLGLLIGGINYIMAMIKKRWYSQDLSDMEYVVEVLGLIAFAFSSHLPELLSEESNVTIVKNPGEEDMEDN